MGDNSILGCILVRFEQKENILLSTLHALAALFFLFAGFLWFPFFLVALFLFWLFYLRSSSAPNRQMERAKIAETFDWDVSVKDLRDGCESPAETAFLDAMASAYSLSAGKGAVEGSGLRLRSQVGLGDLIIARQDVYSQYRADFLIDEKLVVEIDGAAYHSSEEAIARDTRKDKDIYLEGYEILRIPARIVLYTPSEAVKMVKTARETLQNGGTLRPEVKEAQKSANAKDIRLRDYPSHMVKSLGSAADRLNTQASQMYGQVVVEHAIKSLFIEIETLVVSASQHTEFMIDIKRESDEPHDEQDTRKIFKATIKKMVAAQNENGRIEERSASIKQAFSKLEQVLLNQDTREYCAGAIERAVEVHMDIIRTAHEAIFQDFPAFPNDRLYNVTQRDRLLKGVHLVFFEGADPEKFYHPYNPGYRDIVFATWWRNNIGGHDPLTVMPESW